MTGRAACARAVPGRAPWTQALPDRAVFAWRLHAQTAGRPSVHPGALRPGGFASAQGPWPKGEQWRAAVHGRGRGAGGQAHGFSLVIVLLLLAAVALGSVHALKLSSGSARAAGGFRMQALAWQAAEAALRYCEAQLMLLDAQRPAALREAAMPVTQPSSPAWALASRWQGDAVLSPPTEWWRPEDAAVGNWPSPQCLAERQPWGDLQVYTVTARGWPPGPRLSPGLGVPGTGTVVWLQSVLLLDAAAGPAAPALRGRVQRRILQSPVAG